MERPPARRRVTGREDTSPVVGGQEGRCGALRRGLRSSPGCTRGWWCGAGVRSALTAHSTGATQDGATRHSAAGGCAVRRELGARGAGHGSMMRTLGAPKPPHRSIFQMLDGFSSASWSTGRGLGCFAAFPPRRCGAGHTCPCEASDVVGHARASVRNGPWPGPDMQGPPVHPPEPTCPCCLPALGEFSEIVPHEGSGPSLAQDGRSSETGPRHMPPCRPRPGHGTTPERPGIERRRADSVAGRPSGILDTLPDAPRGSTLQHGGFA